MSWVKKLYFRQISAFVILGLLVIGCFPSESMAYIVGSAAVKDAASTRAADMDSIQRVLESKIVSERLDQEGLSKAEIKGRLDKLSDAELHQFASQVKSLFPGGQLEVVIFLLVLVIILIVVLQLTSHRVIVK
jgi:uncharacterized protein DUF6627